MPHSVVWQKYKKEENGFLADNLSPPIVFLLNASPPVRVFILSVAATATITNSENEKHKKTTTNLIHFPVSPSIVAVTQKP